MKVIPLKSNALYSLPMSELTLYDYRSSICSQMARLALVEKGVSFQRRQIDDEVVTNTIRIVSRV